MKTTVWPYSYALSPSLHPLRSFLSLSLATPSPTIPTACKQIQHNVISDDTQIQHNDISDDLSVAPGPKYLLVTPRSPHPTGKNQYDYWNLVNS